MSTNYSSLSRTFVACLISSLMVLGQLAPLASARPGSRPVAEKTGSSTAANASEPDPVSAPAPFAPNITATQTDSFPDLNGDLKADPGETITYTATLANTGPDAATGVQFTNTIDANTTLVPGSLKISPLAFDDAYVAAQNTALSVGAPGVLTNDTGTPAPTAVPIAGGATTQGGTVTLNADGSFLYNPPAAFIGTDTFTYTATNGQAPNNTATVTINVDAPPSVTATTPTNGATNQSTTTNLSITFSEAVNVTGNWFQVVCGTSGTRNVADTVITGGPTTFTINPNVDFAANETCTVTVSAAQVSDQDTNDPPDNMAADFVFSFTTALVELAPTVSSTTPTNGALAQATNANIDVTFSEAVNVTGNWFQIVCGSSGTRNVAATVVTGGPTAFTINPNVDFTAGETCTVTVFAAQVTDQDANDPPDNMAANFVFSFTIEDAPTVTATTPTNGASQLASNTNVSITFSEPVNVTGNWFQLVGATSGTRNVADTVVTGGPTTFTINPNVDFANGELVTVTIFAAQVADQDTGDPPDNMAANFVFSFTIDQAPSVTATTPTNGATNQALNSNVSITFSEPVNVAGNWFQISCANSGTRNVADTVVTGGPTTFTINPNADFTPNEVCTVTVTAAQVTDQDSGDPPNNMVANFVFSFTTIDIAPTVTSTTPTNGAVNQTANSDISVTFSEPVNVTGNWFQIVCGSSGTRNVAATVVSGGPTTFTINPNVDFAAGEICTTTIFAAQVTDQDTNDPPDNMAANFVFSFTMDAAPSVIATTPTNGATQLANNTNVSITFSEAVNVTGNWFQIVGATSGTRNVADAVVTGGPTTFTINPNVDFANGELVTVTVFAAQVADQDGNDPPDNMLANFVFTFTIDQAPSVTTTVPTNGAIDVLKGSNIVVNFSEAVNATTSSFTIECSAPGNLQPYAVSGSGTNQITLNPTSDLPPGVICTATVIANQISDTDAGDPPDNMVANFVFSFGVKPEATDDARNATGNIQIVTTGRSNFSVMTNDIGPGITVTAFDATSLRGGTVSVVGASGTFSYNPPAGYEGADSFNYTIANSAGSDVGTVNITVAGMIWFIDDNAASGACTTNNNTCGRLTNPFSTLAAFEAANGNATPINGTDVIAPEAGDHIFIFSGSYTAPLTLENNQRVIGQGATSSLQTLSGITPATDSDTLPSTGGAAPTVTSAGNGFNVVSNNQLYGLAFSNTTGTAINSNAGVGTFILGDVTINNSGSNGAGLDFDDGGTSVTSTGINTINTRSATALDVTNTTIGVANLTFRSISAGNATADADPASGIILNNTGSVGGLVVTGNSAGLCGGSVGNGPPASAATTTAPVTADCTGGTIQSATGPGIVLTSTSNVSLTRIQVINGGNDGIQGTNVTGFSLISSYFNNNGNAIHESGLDFGDTSSLTPNGLHGTGVITNSTVHNSYYNGVSIRNNGGTALTSFNITGSQFRSLPANGDSNDNVFIEAGGTANMAMSVSGSHFSSIEGDHFQAAALNTGTLNVVLTNNTLTGGHDTPLGQGITINAATGVAFGGYTGRIDYDVNGNNINGAVSNGASIVLGTSGAPESGAGAVFDGFVRNNVIGTSGVALSCSTQANGVYIDARGNGTHNSSVTGNTIRRCFDRGILTEAGDGDSVLNLTVQSNTIDQQVDTSLTREAIQTNFGITSTNVFGNVDTPVVCLQLGGAGALANTFSHGTGAPDDFRLRKRFEATVRLPGYAGGTGQTAPELDQVVAFIRSQNTGSAGEPGSASASGTGGGYLGGAGCTTPSGPVSNTTLGTQAEGSDTATTSEQLDTPSTDILPAPSTRSDEIIQSSNGSFAGKPHNLRKGKVGGTVLRNSVNNGWLGQSQLNAPQQKKKPGTIRIPGAVPPSPNAGETISPNIGTLPAGESVTITYQVTVNSPYFGGPNVSNQGTVSGTNFANVLTDDPAVGGANDPTLTPILQNPNISVSNAQANEPPASSASMLFTVSLSIPAPAGGATVHYSTADQAPGAGHAVAGTDYTAVPDMVLSFAAGEQFKAVSVSILSDADAAEPDETFELNLSNATNGVIVDGQGIGTIKQGNAAGTFLISELRTSGPAGLGDDFVELYNNSDAPLTVAASDASAGYGIYKMGADCSAAPVLIGVIPNGTVIPARGHYLLTGSAYSLSNYGGTGAAAGNLTMSSDIESDRNVAVFSTSDLIAISSANRLDAVGFGPNTGGLCDLLREGTTLPVLSGSTTQHSYQRDVCGKAGSPGGGICSSNTPVDTNNNATNFLFADTQGTSIVGLTQRLGAPGPENLASPVQRNSTILSNLLDQSIAAALPPNRVRDLTPNPGNNATNGTLSIRRRWANNTGAPVTRLRFRIIDISSFPSPSGGVADVRGITSTLVVISGVNDPATCLASTGSATTPCTVNVQGTTLEQPPNQTLGGALNSSLSAGTITLGTPLAAGASINLQFLLGVQTTGAFKFYINVEALP